MEKTMAKPIKKKAAPKGVSWGTTNVPKEKWIDITKTYKTRNGKEVEGLHIVMHNSCGDEVTYPVKGSVVVKKRPRKTEYHIWSLDGRANTVFKDTEHRDLILVEEK